jgi:hypothetical protein
VFIGDRWRDVEPARAFAGRGILIAGVATPQEDRERAEREGVEIVDSLADAVSHSSLARR